MSASTDNQPQDKFSAKLEAIRLQLEKMQIEDIREANAMLRRMARRYMKNKK